MNKKNDDDGGGLFKVMLAAIGFSWLIGAVAYCALIVGVIYVVLHFVAKFW